MSSETQASETHAPDTHEHAHPGPGEYIKIALILGVVTAIEVAAYYVKGLSDTTLSVALLVMMVVKFALVGLWFMHLRFDSKLFRRLFITGIVLAIGVYVAAMATLGVRFWG